MKPDYQNGANGISKVGFGLYQKITQKLVFEIVRPVPEILRQWVTDVHEETKHTGYVLGSLRIRESVSKIGGKSVNVWAMKTMVTTRP